MLKTTLLCSTLMFFMSTVSAAIKCSTSEYYMGQDPLTLRAHGCMEAGAYFCFVYNHCDSDAWMASPQLGDTLGKCLDGSAAFDLGCWTFTPNPPSSGGGGSGGHAIDQVQPDSQ
ncbi:hypothetical protein EMPS_11101 [Entomortierella parvispora]|uniref:Secreted protein n=1 Tax=Entomortierella parvispora TaxID=205924 RepID=A0A9P3M203_9FUNG|nr:hypothetical protein EMPS_11101 [Entomortierella parvispora]